VASWCNSRGLAGEGRPIVVLAPGAVGPSKRWMTAGYAALARRLLADGLAVWVAGGPGEKALAAQIVGDTGLAISPATTCAMPFSRSPPLPWRSPTIPACSTSLQ